MYLSIQIETISHFKFHHLESSCVCVCVGSTNFKDSILIHNVSYFFSTHL